MSPFFHLFLIKRMEKQLNNIKPSQRSMNALIWAIALTFCIFLRVGFIKTKYKSLQGKQ